MTIAPTSGFRYSKFIVSPTAGQGTHTTIQAAINAASSGDVIFVRTGSYTENLTLAAGVDLCAWPGDAADGNVTIVGTCTLTVATTVNISSIRLQTNSAALLAVTGSAASIINLNNCYLNCTNNTGITFSSSDAGAKINLMGCTGDLGTTGIALFSHSSSGVLQAVGCYFTNSGSSVTSSTVSAGTFGANISTFSSPITTSGTGAFSSDTNAYICGSLNTTAVTIGGSGGSVSRYDIYSSGSASAISVGSTLTLGHPEVDSSNTNAITGAGTVTYGTVDFTGSSKVINTTTQAVVNGTTYTPVLAFGGGSTGITYTTQSGRWLRTANMVTFSVDITLSSKGSSTGTATVTLPFTARAGSPTVECFAVILTVTTTGTYTIADIAASGTAATLVQVAATTGTAAALADTAFQNTSVIRFGGSYWI